MEKVTIGFFGGALSLRVSSEQLDGLLKALAAGCWHDVEAEDGTVRLNLAVVVYVKTDRDQHRVGFGV